MITKLEFKGHHPRNHKQTKATKLSITAQNA